MFISLHKIFRKLTVYFGLGFDALGYQEHLDYGLVRSTNPDDNKALVRVNIFRDHRQTIQVFSFNYSLFTYYNQYLLNSCLVYSPDRFK